MCVWGVCGCTEKKTNNKGGAAAPGAKGGAAGGKKGGKKGGAKAPKPVTKDDLDAQLAQYKHEGKINGGEL